MKSLFGVGDLTQQTGEDFSGADFDEVGCALSDEELDALDPANGAGHLTHEAVARIRVAGDHAGVDVACDGKFGVMEGYAFEVNHERLLRGCH